MRYQALEELATADDLAAVLGLRFDPDVLEKALDADGDLVLDGIEEAEAANLVFPAPGGRESRYEFSHALVWGRSAKHQPQRCGKDHQLMDEDVVQICKKV